MLKAQHQRLAPQHDGRFSSHLDWSALHNLNGAILSNELLDAFPVDLIRFDGSDWKQLKVDTSDTGTLELHPFALGEPDSCPLAAFCAQLGTQFPEGYTSEYNPGIETFAEQASRTLASGALITIDYGHSSEDYYHPGRSEGTLQTYHQHQKSDDPLVMPGEIDITCHVDFGRLQRGAENAGFTSASLRSQASYLTDHARDWLLSIENPDTPTDPDTPKRLRQFQSLIHPAMLGTRFSVLEMRK